MLAGRTIIHAAIENFRWHGSDFDFRRGLGTLWVSTLLQPPSIWDAANTVQSHCRPHLKHRSKWLICIQARGGLCTSISCKRLARHAARASRDLDRRSFRPGRVPNWKKHRLHGRRGCKVLGNIYICIAVGQHCAIVDVTDADSNWSVELGQLAEDSISATDNDVALQVLATPAPGSTKGHGDISRVGASQRCVTGGRLAPVTALSSQSHLCATRGAPAQQANVRAHAGGAW